MTDDHPQQPDPSVHTTRAEYGPQYRYRHRPFDVKAREITEDGIVFTSDGLVWADAGLMLIFNSRQGRTFLLTRSQFDAAYDRVEEI